MADRAENNKVPTRNAPNSDQEPQRSRGPDDRPTPSPRDEMNRKTAPDRVSAAPSSPAPVANHITATESPTKKACNGLLQQNRHKADTPIFLLLVCSFAIDARNPTAHDQKQQTWRGAKSMSSTRRQFLATAGSFALLAAGKCPAGAAMGPNDKFDLVIKGGDVLDPSQSLRGRRDIGIRFGVIEALEADIPAERAQRVLDASGKLVTPGLVDLHTHVYPYGSAIGIPADELVAYQCTTTCVSAGDAGANNFAAFRRYVAAQTRTRVYAFVHIANIGLAGFPVAELYNIDFAQTDVAARAIAENADMVLGAKVRMSENVIAKNGLEPLKRAIAACESAGTGGKVMCHIGGVETRALMSQILDLLRPGDVLTHCYSGFPNLAGDFTNIVQDGRL